MLANRILSALLLLCTALMSASCATKKGSGLAGAVPGSGNVQSERRDTGAFEAITVEYPADVIILQGEPAAVEIEADDNLLPQLSTEVSSGRLTIKSRETEWGARVNPSKMVKITVTVMDLAEIDFAGPVGSLEMNDFQAPKLKLVLSGGAQLRLQRIQVDLLDSVFSGVGDIQIDGTADELRLVMSGMGDFNAADLKSNKAMIELSGTGGVTVRVETELKATVTGAGSVEYFGNPRVEKKVEGLGSVKPAG